MCSPCLEAASEYSFAYHVTLEFLSSLCLSFCHLPTLSKSLVCLSLSGFYLSYFCWLLVQIFQALWLLSYSSEESLRVQIHLNLQRLTYRVYLNPAPALDWLAHAHTNLQTISSLFARRHLSKAWSSCCHWVLLSLSGSRQTMDPLCSFSSYLCSRLLIWL